MDHQSRCDPLLLEDVAADGLGTRQGLQDRRCLVVLVGLDSPVPQRLEGWKRPAGVRPQVRTDHETLEDDRRQLQISQQQGRLVELDGGDVGDHPRPVLAGVHANPMSPQAYAARQDHLHLLDVHLAVEEVFEEVLDLGAKELPPGSRGDEVADCECDEQEARRHREPNCESSQVNLQGGGVGGMLPLREP